MGGVTVLIGLVSGGVDCALPYYPAVLTDFNFARVHWLYHFLRKESILQNGKRNNFNNLMTTYISNNFIQNKTIILNEDHIGLQKADAYGKYFLVKAN